VKSNLWAARLVIFAAFFDLFLQFPVVAPYAEELGASPVYLGLIVGAFSASNIVGNIVAGLVIDRWGRKVPIEIGLVTTVLVLILYAVSSTPDQLLGTRLLHGLSVSVLTPGAFSMIGDSTTGGQRARAMGISGTLIGLTAVTAPPLAGIMGDRLGFTAVFVGSAVVMLSVAVFFWLMTHSQERHREIKNSEGKFLTGVVKIWTRPSLLLANFSVFGLTVANGTMITVLPINFSASESGMAFSVYAVIAVLVMGGPTNRLSDRWGRAQILGSSLGIMAIGLSIIAALEGFGFTLLGMAVFGLGFGLLFPAATALVADGSNIDERGGAFGMFYAVYSGGVVVGTFASGLIMDIFGDATRLPFAFAAGTVLLGAIVLITVSRVFKKSSAAGIFTAAPEFMRKTRNS
tara:strand:- start:1796 stop:3007 length:1212 start_codon:yes stop_codon:yes gene_type:complete